MATPKQYLRDPDEFGEPLARWSPDEDADPVEIAAAWLQHRVVGAVRTLLASERLMKDQLIAATGTSSGNFDSKLSGGIPIRLVDIVRWALAGGTEVLDALPADASDLFPPEFTEWLGGWEAGHGTLPAFIDPSRFPRGLGELDWPDITSRLHSRVAEEVAQGREPFLTDGVVRHNLVMTLLDIGVPLERLIVEHIIEGVPAPVDVAFNAPETDVFAVLHTNSRRAQSHDRPRTAARMLGRIFDLDALQVENRTVVLGFSGGAEALLADYFENLREVDPGDVLATSLSALNRLASHDAVGTLRAWNGTVAEMTVLAKAASDLARVLVCRFKGNSFS